MGFLSPEKLILIVLLIALVFGTKGLPALARRTGKGIRETRDALGLDAIREDVQEVRSTFSEPLGITKSSEAGAAAEEPDSAPGTSPPL